MIHETDIGLRFLRRCANEKHYGMLNFVYSFVIKGDVDLWSVRRMLSHCWSG